MRRRGEMGMEESEVCGVKGFELAGFERFGIEDLKLKEFHSYEEWFR